MPLTIYQHFRKHEHPFVDQVLSWKEQVERTYTYYVTDFLDPREQQIITSLIGTKNEEIRFSFFGGTESVERKRAVIAPFYEEVDQASFGVTLLEATYPKQFIQIRHKDILGALLALGIDRKKIGDIVVGEDRFQIVATEALAPYIMLHLLKVKHANIRLVEQPAERLLKNQDTWLTESMTVSSMRLDVLIKEMYRLSRKDAANYIKGNRVKVNFTPIDDPAIPLFVDDLISVRGFGRGKIVEINGKTRKEKIRVTTAKLKP